MSVTVSKLHFHGKVRMGTERIFFVQVGLRLKQKYYTLQVHPDQDSHSWPPDHDSTFHVPETPALTTRPSATQRNYRQLSQWHKDIREMGIKTSARKYDAFRHQKCKGICSEQKHMTKMLKRNRKQKTNINQGIWAKNKHTVPACVYVKGYTKLMSWSSDFRSIILRGREFFILFNIKKSLSSDLQSA